MEKPKSNLKPLKPNKTRLYIGGFVFLIGIICPVFIPLVIASGLSNGLKTLISGLLGFGIPELFMIIAAGILGKAGFQYIKRLFRVLFRRYGPPGKVSKTRYIIGLVLFFIPIFTALLLPYFFNLSPVFYKNYILISVILDGMLVISLFVLGGDFWDKLRGLFNRNARIQNP
ncbi:MAG: hypothetical protein R2750_12700 [Bacteroidales bacterium]